MKVCAPSDTACLKLYWHLLISKVAGVCADLPLFTSHSALLSKLQKSRTLLGLLKLSVLLFRGGEANFGHDKSSQHLN